MFLSVRAILGYVQLRSTADLPAVLTPHTAVFSFVAGVPPSYVHEKCKQHVGTLVCQMLQYFSSGWYVTLFSRFFFLCLLVLFIWGCKSTLVQKAKIVLAKGISLSGDFSNGFLEADVILDLCASCSALFIWPCSIQKGEREMGGERLMSSQVHEDLRCESSWIRNLKLEERVEKANIEL